MYHHIAPPPVGGEHPGLFVAPERFESQMAYLKARGYEVAPLDRVREALLGRARLPRRTVAITFDDGGADIHLNALPILRRYGFPATVFLVAGKIGKTRLKRGWPPVASRYLNETEIAEMLGAGIEFGSHTLTHIRLAKADPQRCEYELAESKRLIEQMTGRQVGWLSYPFGSFSRRTIEIARRLGYVGAVSTIRDNRATAARLYYLPRVMVMHDADERRFAHYLSWTYHAVHWLKNRRRWAKVDRWFKE